MRPLCQPVDLDCRSPAPSPFVYTTLPPRLTSVAHANDNRLFGSTSRNDSSHCRISPTCSMAVAPSSARVAPTAGVPAYYHRDAVAATRPLRRGWQWTGRRHPRVTLLLLQVHNHRLAQCSLAIVYYYRLGARSPRASGFRVAGAVKGAHRERFATPTQGGCAARG